MTDAARELNGGDRPPAGVLAFVERLEVALGGLPDDPAVGVYLHGSAVLGGWRPTVSDVDVLVVLPDALPGDVVDEVARITTGLASTCPGRGLELSAVSRGEAALPRAPWRFLLHVTGSVEDGPRVVEGRHHAGDPDLRLHYAVCRQAAWSGTGPPAAEVIGEVTRPIVLRALAEELDWGGEHASAAYTLLNACRARVYLDDGLLVAKTTGGEWVLAREIGPSVSVHTAMAAEALSRL